jgi:hypothetical protein
MVTVATPPAAKVVLRSMPDEVTLTGEQYAELLGRLTAVEELFSTFDGNCRDGALATWAGQTLTLFDEEVIGYVGETDEAWDRDPIKVETEARGSQIASELLAKMSGLPTFCMDGILPFEFNPRETYQLLETESMRLAGASKKIREGGSL